MMDFSMADIIPALPEIFLSGVALVLVLVAAYGGETAANARRVTQLAIGGIAIALVMVAGSMGETATAFGGMYAADSFSGYMKLLVMIGTIAALAMSLHADGDSDINKPEYSLLVLLALVGMMLMCLFWWLPMAVKQRPIRGV